MSAGTEEPRRSGRATKGQHKNVSSSPIATPKPAKATKRKSTKKAAEPEVNENEEEEKIRCICGDSNPKDKRAFIGCDACEVWQHNVCMGVPEDEDDVPEHYWCEECGPDLHIETLQAMSRGEKIWETRTKIYQNEKKSKGRKNRNKANEDVKPGWLKKEYPKDAANSVDPSVNASTEAPNSTPAPVPTPAPDPTPVPDPATDVDPAPTAQEETTRETGTKRKREELKEDVEQAKVEQKEEKPTRSTRQDKRRKSSTVENKPSKDAETALVDLNQLPQDRQKVAQVLRKIISDGIDQRVKGGHQLAEGETSKSLGEHHAVRIEYALFMNHGPPKEAAYGLQFRALNANLKKNHLLVERLMKGTLTADELATMNSSDMASEELQKERAIMKEVLDRQSIAITEEGPRYRQDHKGYRLIEDENQHLTDHPVPRATGTASNDEDEKKAEDGEQNSVSSPTVNEGSAVESKKSHPGMQRRSSSQQFDMSNIWAKAAQSPTTATPQAGSRIARRPSSSRPVSAQQNGAKHDPDVDRMLEDHDEAYSPADGDGSDAVVWRGKLVQANEDNPPTVNARFVAGRDLASTVSWPSLLPESLSIDGRLQIRKAEDYLCGLRWSNTSDVAVLALTPFDNAEAFNATFNYFFSRERYAVVEKGKPPMVKDLYIIPVEVGADLPAHIDMLEHCTIKKPVEERLLLATLIVARSPNSPPAQLDGTPSHQQAGNIPQHIRQSIGGPAGSPLTTQAPTFSPPNSTGPQQIGYGNSVPPNPYASPSQQAGAYPSRIPHVNPRVNAILGDLQYEVTAQQILGMDPNLDDMRLQNLKRILIDQPGARHDMNILSKYLFAA